MRDCNLSDGNEEQLEGRWKALLATGAKTHQWNTCLTAAEFGFAAP